MKEIDWSKAPTDATHYNQFACHWIKHLGNGSYQFLKGDEWEMGFGCMDSRYIERPEPEAWSGEGLPPVGTVCEAWHNGCAQGVVQVRYSGGCMVLWNVKLKHEQCSASENYTFKPIRTPEQIAAEEREKAIEEMARIGTMADTPKSMAAKLYDAGCRMVTP